MNDTPTPRPTSDATPGKRASITRLLSVALIVLAIIVAATMIALWPDRTTEPTGPESQLPQTERAEVVKTERVDCDVPSANACLEATVKLLTGADSGDRVSFILGDADDESKARVGDVIRVVKSQVPEDAQIGGIEVPPYSFSDFERRAPTFWLVGLFIAIVLITGRLHGLRALVGLTLSLGVVVWFIIPALVQGDRPIVVAMVGALAVMLLTIPLSHGIGPVTIAATLGTTASLLLTLGLALLFSHLAHLTGYSGDEVAYLSAYLGDLSVQGLLLAGIVISTLGVLDDVTVSQASTVMALRRANPLLGFRELYSRALVVGRDHIAATVNTLVLAYVGASLPILLVFAIGDIPVLDAFNSEAVAAQIIATLVGSIGLIAAMPATTALAALLATRMQDDELAMAQSHGHSHTAH